MSCFQGVIVIVFCNSLGDSKFWNKCGKGQIPSTPGKTQRKNGGSAWESNPPGTVLAPHTGFEVRELHQTAAHFHKPLKAILTCLVRVQQGKGYIL